LPTSPHKGIPEPWLSKIDRPRFFQKSSNIFASWRWIHTIWHDRSWKRNIQRDRDDVKHLAKTVPFDLAVLKERYQKELRWQLGNPEREDLTLRLWVGAIKEERSR